MDKNELYVKAGHMDFMLDWNLLDELMAAMTSSQLEDCLKYICRMNGIDWDSIEWEE